MYGAAVLDACEQIKARMEPIVSGHNFGSFAEVIIPLFISGSYITTPSMSAIRLLKHEEISFSFLLHKTKLICLY